MIKFRTLAIVLAVLLAGGITFVGIDFLWMLPQSCSVSFDRIPLGIRDVRLDGRSIYQSPALYGPFRKMTSMTLECTIDGKKLAATLPPLREDSVISIETRPPVVVLNGTEKISFTEAGE